MEHSLTLAATNMPARREKSVRKTFGEHILRIMSAPKNALNITYNADSPAARMLSNLAPTPFILDGRRYESVEAFWQGLKFEDERRRAVIAKLSGLSAKNIGEFADVSMRFRYNDKNYVVGSSEHHDLMRRAIREKLLQNPGVLDLLLSTKNTPLIHVPRKKDGAPYPDSKTIPGVVFSQILTDLRAEFALKNNSHKCPKNTSSESTSTTPSAKVTER